MPLSSRQTHRIRKQTGSPTRRHTDQTNKENRRLAAPKLARMPKSTMVAVSTPGWTVDHYGRIVPEPSTQRKDQGYNDESTCEDTRSPRAEIPDSEGFSSYKDSKSRETSEVLEYSSKEDKTAPDAEPDHQPIAPWTRPAPPMSAAAILAVLRYSRMHKNEAHAAEEVVSYFQSSGSPIELVNESLVIWLLVCNPVSL